MKFIVLVLFSLSMVACSHNAKIKPKISSNEDKNCVNEHYQLVKCEKIHYLTTKDKNGKIKRVTVSF